MTRDDASVREMQRLLHRLTGRDPLELDDATCERMLSGRIAPDDAPPAYRRVAQVIGLVEEPAKEAIPGGELRAVASIAAEIRRAETSAPRRSTVHTKRRMTQLAAITVAGGTSLFGGLAAAGALPGAAQGIASDMLDTVGVSVPGPNTTAGEHPNVRGKSETAGVNSDSNGNGSTISDLARTTTATGVDKGAEISDAASDGKSHAGEHGAAGGATPASTPPVSVPNGGGTGTADTASDGRSATGTENAATHSDGRSAGGSGNAAGHTP